MKSRKLLKELDQWTIGKSWSLATYPVRRVVGDSLIGRNPFGILSKEDLVSDDLSPSVSVCNVYPSENLTFSTVNFDEKSPYLALRLSSDATFELHPPPRQVRRGNQPFKLEAEKTNAAARPESRRIRVRPHFKNLISRFDPMKQRTWKAFVLTADRTMPDWTLVRRMPRRKKLRRKSVSVQSHYPVFEDETPFDGSHRSSDKRRCLHAKEKFRKANLAKQRGVLFDSTLGYPGEGPDPMVCPHCGCPWWKGWECPCEDDDDTAMLFDATLGYPGEGPPKRGARGRGGARAANRQAAHARGHGKRGRGRGSGKAGEIRGRDILLDTVAIVEAMAPKVQPEADVVLVITNPPDPSTPYSLEEFEEVFPTNPVSEPILAEEIKSVSEKASSFTKSTVGLIQKAGLDLIQRARDYRAAARRKPRLNGEYMGMIELQDWNEDFNNPIMTVEEKVWRPEHDDDKTEGLVGPLRFGLDGALALQTHNSDVVYIPPLIGEEDEEALIALGQNADAKNGEVGAVIPAGRPEIVVAPVDPPRADVPPAADAVVVVVPQQPAQHALPPRAAPKTAEQLRGELYAIVHDILCKATGEYVNKDPASRLDRQVVGNMLNQLLRRGQFGPISKQYMLASGEAFLSFPVAYQNHFHRRRFHRLKWDLRCEHAAIVIDTLDFAIAKAVKARTVSARESSTVSEGSQAKAVWTYLSGKMSPVQSLLDHVRIKQASKIDVMKLFESKSGESYFAISSKLLRTYLYILCVIWALTLAEDLIRAIVLWTFELLFLSNVESRYLHTFLEWGGWQFAHFNVVFINMVYALLETYVRSLHNGGQMYSSHILEVLVRFVLHIHFTTSTFAHLFVNTIAWFVDPTLFCNLFVVTGQFLTKDSVCLDDTSKNFNVNKLRPDYVVKRLGEARCVAKLGTYGAWGISGMLATVYRQCHHNEKISMDGRVGKWVPGVGSAQVLGAWRALQRNILPIMARRIQRVVHPVPFEEWVSSFPPGKREILRKVKTTSFVFESQKWKRGHRVRHRASSFIKVESYTHHEDWISEELYKDPRFIQGCPIELSVCVGPVMRKMGKHVKKGLANMSFTAAGIREGRQFYYSSGNTAEETGRVFGESVRLISSLMDADDEVIFIEDDQSRFDMHILDGPFGFLDALYRQKLSKRCRYLLQRSKSRGTSSLGTSYEVDSTMQSGWPDTSVGDTIINCAMKYYLHGYGRLWLSIVCGDDSVTITTRKTLELMGGVKALSKGYTSLGFDATIKVVRDPLKVNFCSSSFMPCGETYVLLPFTGKLLSKLGWDKVKRNEAGSKAYHRGVASVLANYGKYNPVLLGAGAALKRSLGNGKVIEFEGNPYTHTLSDKRLVAQQYPSQLDIATYFDRRYGFPEWAVLEIISHSQSFGYGIWSTHPLFVWMARVDSSTGV